MVIDTYADRLFHRYYLVTIPACDYYDPEFVKVFGMHQHPDKKIADAMVEDRIHTHLSPAYMASWASDGIDIRFCDAKDSVKVFEDIMGHLNDWRQFLAESPLVAKIPMEGLHQFHMFAKLVYKLARDNGLADQYKVEKQLWNIMSLYRKGTNLNQNPYRFKFNGDIWLDILEYAKERRVDVRRFKDADLTREADAAGAQEKTYDKIGYRPYRR